MRACSAPAKYRRNCRPRLDNSGRRWHHGITSSRTGKALMKQFVLKIFTWWNGQTFGTQLWTWRFDIVERPPSCGHRRLPGLDAGKLIEVHGVETCAREVRSDALSGINARIARP